MSEPASVSVVIVRGLMTLSLSKSPSRMNWLLRRVPVMTMAAKPVCWSDVQL
jgi:hypothetical protein